MGIRVGGVVFGFGNPVAGVAGGGGGCLVFQEIRVKSGGGGGVKNLAIHREPRWLIYSTLHLKYICIFWLYPSS